MEWVLGVLGATTVVLTAAAAIGRTVRWGMGGVRKLFRLADDLLGEAAHGGLPARPGLMERVGTIESLVREHGERLERGDRRFDELGGRLDAIAAELHPNGGSSLRDRVDALTHAIRGQENASPRG